jgi:acetylornithine deacetylase/succinyl-diaminopimelate desuccinylase-like protein
MRKQPELFALFSNTMTITAIKSDSSSINQIPQGISAILDCRLLPEYSKSEFINELDKLLDNDKIRINVIQEMSPGVNGDKNSEFFTGMADAINSYYSNCEVYPIMLPSFSDVGEFRRYGVQGFAVIPVDLDTDCIVAIHAENERIPIKALEQGINVYLNFLENVCLN